MSPLRATATLLLAIPGALVGCSLFVDTGEYTSGGPARDAGTAADGGQNVDGGRRSCAAVSPDVFCADFENGPVESGWDGKQEEQGGTITLDSTLGFESVHSAASRFSRRDDARATYASLMKRVDGVRSCSVEFDAWVTTPSWGQNGTNFAISALTFGTGSGSSAYFSIAIERDAVSLGFQTPDFDSVRDNHSFPYDQWVHVGLDVDWTAHVASLRLDGSPIAVTPFAVPSLGATPATLLEVGFIGFNPPQPDVMVNIDNVFFSRR